MSHTFADKSFSLFIFISEKGGNLFKGNCQYDYVGETMKRFFGPPMIFLANLKLFFKDIKSFYGSVKYLDNKGTEVVGK